MHRVAEELEAIRTLMFSGDSLTQEKESSKPRDLRQEHGIPENSGRNGAEDLKRGQEDCSALDYIETHAERKSPQRRLSMCKT